MSAEDELKKEYDQTLLMKESALDLLGHFSTAAAILAGFFLTAVIFLISVNVERSSDEYTFLDEPIGDQFGIMDAIQQLLPETWVNEYWPSHFTYMLLIFITLFVFAMFSYACYILAGLAHMRVLEGKKASLERIWFWQKWGLRILMLNLIAAFISLPWVLLRFIFEQALTWTVSILVIVLIIAVILSTGIRWVRRKK